MYIYNRTSRFQQQQGVPFSVTSHINAKRNSRSSIIKSGSSYKIKSRKPSSHIKTKSVRVSRPPKLSKKNIAFLTELGYKVIKN